MYRLLLLKVTETGYVKGTDVDASHRVEVVASAEHEDYRMLPTPKQLVEEERNGRQ